MTSDRALSFGAFRSRSYFAELDGLRAISVLLVVTNHMQDPAWDVLHGSNGVGSFFVISGFLITTLLLREQDRNGRVALGGFYVRRAFRLLPLYYLVLAVYAVAALALHLGPWQKFQAAVPYFLTYQNDFVADGPFGHTWSLAVEEKFYLFWPLLAFGVAALARRRVAIATTALAASVVALLVPGFDYFASYTGILLGCLIAFALHNPRSYRVVVAVTRQAWALPLAVAVAGAALLVPWDSGRHHILFAAGFAVLLTVLLTQRHAGRRWLGSRFAAWAGTRSYAAYLIHPLVVEAVNKAIDDEQTNPVLIAARFVLVTAVTFAAADILFRVVESPLTNVGRKLAKRLPSRALRPTAAVATA